MIPTLHSGYKSEREHTGVTTTSKTTVYSVSWTKIMCKMRAAAAGIDSDRTAGGENLFMVKITTVARYTSTNIHKAVTQFIFICYRNESLEKEKCSE